MGPSGIIRLAERISRMDRKLFSTDDVEVQT